MQQAVDDLIKAICEADTAKLKACIDVVDGQFLIDNSSCSAVVTTEAKQTLIDFADGVEAYNIDEHSRPSRGASRAIRFGFDAMSEAYHALEHADDKRCFNQSLAYVNALQSLQDTIENNV